jgi:DNA gyrase subunit B
MSTTSPDYPLSQIQVLSGRAAVRKRPGMYIGDFDDGKAITRMVLEIVSNSLDQFLAGLATSIDVQIESDSSITITDDGVGIAAHDVAGKSFLEHVFTEMHFGPTADGHRPHEHLGLRGIGLAPINFLSTFCQVRTHRDGRAYSQQFRQGEPLSPLADLGPSSARGTQVHFLADDSILDCSWIDVDTISRRLRDLSWLNPGLRITFIDRRQQVFFQPEGLLARFHQVFNALESAPFSMHASQDDIEVQVCAGIPKQRFTCSIKSYVNTEETTEHGAHVDGFVSGLTDALLASQAPKSGTQKAQTRSQWIAAIKQRLAAMILVKLRDPSYGRPTKTRLVSAGVETIVRQLTAAAATEFLAQHPQFAVQLLSK